MRELIATYRQSREEIMQKFYDFLRTVDIGAEDIPRREKKGRLRRIRQAETAFASRVLAKSQLETGDFTKAVDYLRQYLDCFDELIRIIKEHAPESLAGASACYPAEYREDIQQVIDNMQKRVERLSAANVASSEFTQAPQSVSIQVSYSGHPLNDASNAMRHDAGMAIEWAWGSCYYSGVPLVKPSASSLTMR